MPLGKTPWQKLVFVCVCVGDKESYTVALFKGRPQAGCVGVKH